MHCSSFKASLSWGRDFERVGGATERGIWIKEMEGGVGSEHRLSMPSKFLLSVFAILSQSVLSQFIEKLLGWTVRGPPRED